MQKRAPPVLISLLQFILLLPGIALTAYFGTRLGLDAGIKAADIVLFTLGIWCVAWSPLIPIALSLKARLRKLERSLARDLDA